MCRVQLHLCVVLTYITPWQGTMLGLLVKLAIELTMFHLVVEKAFIYLFCRLCLNTFCTLSRLTPCSVNIYIHCIAVYITLKMLQCLELLEEVCQ